MKDILLDIVKHTNGLGFIEAVKVEGTKEETNIAAMDTDRTVMLYGKLNNPVSELIGTFGAANLNFLNWLLNWDYLNDEGSKIDIVRAVRNGSEQPEEIVFTSLRSNGSPWHYRFMNSSLVEEQLKTVKFKGAKWDVTFSPNQLNIHLFNNAAQGMMQFEPYFNLTTKNNQLLMGFGSGSSSHRGQLVFADNINGTLNNSYHWPIAQVLSILKLANNENCTINIADVGALQITVDSGLGSYSYILPAKA